MDHDSADDNDAANYCPRRRPFSQKKKYPDRIQYRLYITNNPSIKRSYSTRHAEREECVRNSYLHNAEV